jgi:Flp pilus assembly protein TadG
MIRHGKTRFRSLLGRLKRDERGGTAIMVGLLLPVLLGFAGFAVDGSHLYAQKTMLQNTADAAARAAIHELPTLANVRTRAIEIARLNMPPTIYGEVVITTEVESGFWSNGIFTVTNAPGANAVRVIARRDVPLTAAAIFGATTSEVNAQAIALLTNIPGHEACVLALEQIETGIEVNGNVDIVVPTCTLMANSAATDAFVVNGNSAYIEAYTIVTVGGISAHPDTLNLTVPPITGSPPATDPYADLPTNFSSLTARSCPSNKCQNTTIQPGRYTSQITFTGNVTLAPGMYYFAGGIKMDGQVNVTGDGVTVAYSGDTKLAGNNVKFTIKAPTTASSTAQGINGVALYGLGATAELNVNAADSYLDGAIYSPQGYVDVGGNGALAGCSQLVAGTIRLHGTPSQQQNCESVPTRPVVVGGEHTVALVQ